MLLQLACCALLASSGCGYRIAGRAAEPGAADLLWIAPVEDNADEPLFGVQLGAALSREAVNRSAFSLSEEGRAARHLRVVVERVIEAKVAFRVGDVVKEYLLRAEATAYLTDPDGELRWKGTGIDAEREFSAGVDVNRTEVNKDAALELLARDLAREIMRRVTLVGVRP